MSGDPYWLSIMDTYRLMAREVRYRPAAPSDGWGNITGRLDLTHESAVYAAGWHKEEEAQRYDIGCPDASDRPAMILIVEAARVLCGTDRDTAAKLLRLALKEIER